MRDLCEFETGCRDCTVLHVLMWWDSGESLCLFNLIRSNAMKLSNIGRISVQLVAATLCLTFLDAQAETKPEVSQTASGAPVKVTSKVVPGKVVPKVVAGAGAISGKGDENQFPSGTIPIPPKPKKEGLDAAAATKVKAAQP